MLNSQWALAVEAVSQERVAPCSYTAPHEVAQDGPGPITIVPHVGNEGEPLEAGAASDQLHAGVPEVEAQVPAHSDDEGLQEGEPVPGGRGEHVAVKAQGCQRCR